MLRTMSIVAVLLAVASVSFATPVTVDIANDGDGAIDCIADWTTGSEIVDIVGNQVWAPGHMLGTITTDDPLDPTLTMMNVIDNDTAFTWTGYTVNVKMSVPFTISGISSGTPGDWSGSLTQAPVLVGSEYVGTIDYYAGTPIIVGGSLGFSYAISFSGSTSYTFCQEMIPTPEPTSLGLLAIGGLALLRRR